MQWCTNFLFVFFIGYCIYYLVLSEPVKQNNSKINSYVIHPIHKKCQNLIIILLLIVQLERYSCTRVDTILVSAACRYPGPVQLNSAAQLLQGGHEQQQSYGASTHTYPGQWNRVA